MEKTKEVEFVIVIVNYNSYDNCRKAVESICKYTRTDNYAVCVYDNHSDDRFRLHLLNEIDPHVITVAGETNAGYAKGNNDAVKYMQGMYKFQYVFIMNPDVEFVEEALCEQLIGRLESKKDGRLVGGQPLSWNYHYGDDPKVQTNIRRIDDLFDLFVLFLCTNRLIFRKKWKKINYIDQRPYDHELKYLIPSGSFFFIDADFFNEIGMFDEDTFLYNEELILGRKLCSAEKQLLFMPQFMVKHEHSASIGSKKYSITWKAYRHEIQSRCVLVKKYYPLKRIHVYMTIVISVIDFCLKKIGGILVGRKNGGVSIRCHTRV